MLRVVFIQEALFLCLVLPLPGALLGTSQCALNPGYNASDFSDQLVRSSSTGVCLLPTGGGYASLCCSNIQSYYDA